MPKPDLEDLLNDYRPCFVFHRAEQCHPCSMETYVANSKLYRDNEEINVSEHVKLLAERNPTIK